MEKEKEEKGGRENECGERKRGGGGGGRGVEEVPWGVSLTVGMFGSSGSEDLSSGDSDHVSG